MTVSFATQWRLLLRAALLIGISVWTSACLSLKDQGNAEFERGNYDQALTHYKSSIDDGDKDPKTFYMAGRSAMFKGDFATAERYFSRSIRHGGGVPVMRALTSLYIQTSNFTRAIDVLRQLTQLDPDKYTVYQNLGVSLLYVKKPIEAEDYLVLAQHEKPTRPVAYFNLGLLYDRHMVRPGLAMEFYRCYIKLSKNPKDPQVTRLTSRIERAGEGVDDKNEFVTCGQKYIATAKEIPVSKLREHVQKMVPLIPDPDPAPDSAPGSAPASPDAKPSQAVIQPSLEEMEAQRKKQELSQAQMTAPLAYEAQKYRLVVGIFESFTLDQLRRQDVVILAQSHQRLGQRLEAVRHWTHLFNQRPDVQSLSALILLEQQANNQSAVLKLCNETKKTKPALFVSVEHLCKAGGSP